RPAASSCISPQVSPLLLAGAAGHVLRASPRPGGRPPGVPKLRAVMPGVFNLSVRATNLGFPRIGASRELKQALESHWQGRSSAEELLATAASLRRRHWQLQQAA